MTPSPAPGPHAVTNSLVVPNVLPVTQALFNKLLSRYGTGDIFSGQADPSGVTWLEVNVGKAPAILGLDMIEYSPTRVVSLSPNKKHLTPSLLEHSNMAQPAQPSKTPLPSTLATAFSPSNGTGTPLHI